MLNFKCSACKKTITTDDSLAGQQGECPFCQKVVVAPGKPKAGAALVEAAAKAPRCAKCGAKKKSGEKCASCGGAKTRRVQVAMPEGVDKRKLMILGGVVAAGLVVGYLVLGGGDDSPKLPGDEMCRRQLLVMHTSVIVCPGGPPLSIGSQFWFDVAQKNNALGMVKCPAGPNKSRRVDYRGPAKPYQELKPNDMLGASMEGNHPDGINILYISGEVGWAPKGSDLYKQALQETKE